MLNASSLPTPWTWPVNVERYDRTTELKQDEVTALERNLPLLESGVLPFNVMRQARVHRLLDPLEDVFNHVRFQRNRRPAMKILLLKEMLKKGRRKAEVYGDGLRTSGSKRLKKAGETGILLRLWPTFSPNLMDYIGWVEEISFSAVWHTECLAGNDFADCSLK
jgi:hypothetical protein